MKALNIYRVLEKKFNLIPYKLYNHKLLDRHYITINQSLRANDYDDAWMFNLAMHSQIIYDVGANMGQASLTMLYNKNITEIYLIDPNPRALAVAAENLFRNNLSLNARFIPAFVSEKSQDSIDFYASGTGAASSMYSKHAKTAAKNGSVSKVVTITLDDLVEKYKSVPDFVKIDVEGAERLVLGGAKKLAGYKKPKFMLEMHSNEDLPMRENARCILNWCQISGYKCWYLKDKIELQSSETIAHRGRCHLLLLPNEMPFPDYLKKIKQGLHIK